MKNIKNFAILQAFLQYFVYNAYNSVNFNKKLRITVIMDIIVFCKCLVFLQQMISIFKLIVIKRPTMETSLHIREIIAEGSAAPRFHFPIITVQT